MLQALIQSEILETGLLNLPTTRIFEFSIKISFGIFISPDARYHV